MCIPRPPLPVLCADIYHIANIFLLFVLYKHHPTCTLVQKPCSHSSGSAAFDNSHVTRRLLILARWIYRNTILFSALTFEKCSVNLNNLTLQNWLISILHTSRMYRCHRNT